MFPEEDNFTTATAFAEVFAALDTFADSTKTDEGREAIVQCKRHLQVAYQYFEDDDDSTGSRTVQEAEELFRKARRFIAVSDE